LPYEHYFIFNDQIYLPKKEKLSEIKDKYKPLNEHQFFDRNLIVDTKKVKILCSEIPEHLEFKINTFDNKEIYCSLFKRNSQKLIVIGPGFSNQKEKMIPFAAMFNDYDVLLINYRGHVPTPYKIDLQTRLGSVEDDDIISIMQYIKSNYQYEKIVGIGICFGGYTLAKAQAKAEKIGRSIFDALIVDGCWLSMENTIDKLCSDPYLLINPQKGSQSFIAKILFGSTLIQEIVKKLIEYLLVVDLKKLDATNWLGDLKKTPIFFIHSKPDLVISWDSFKTIYQQCQSSDKAAWITPHAHVINHLKSKELYAHITRNIIENTPFNKIIDELSCPENES
jgi:esterase/lipase